MSMQTNRRSIDVYVRGEKGTETQCYRLRQEMWDVLSSEQQNSSSGTNYYRHIIRPQDVKEGKDEPVAYNFNDVLECEKNGNIYISAGGETESRDSIKELLYCNSNETILVTEQHFSQDPPSDAQLWSIARDISDCWFQIGTQIGLPKHELDRIKVDYTDEEVVATYLAGKPPVESAAAIRTQFKFRNMVQYSSPHPVENFHIGFDPDYELIKNTRPVSTKTPDERIVYLVMAIELEVKSEQFRLCFMSQNRAVVENKRLKFLENLPTVMVFSCLQKFIRWLKDGIYDFHTLPFTLKTHLPLEYQEALLQIPEKWKGAKSNL
eukprot:Em0018g902a